MPLQAVGQGATVNEVVAEFLVETMKCRVIDVLEKKNQCEDEFVPASKELASPISTTSLLDKKTKVSQEAAGASLDRKRKSTVENKEIMPAKHC